jgi:hypothetical protein
LISKLTYWLPKINIYSGLTNTINFLTSNDNFKKLKPRIYNK